MKTTLQNFPGRGTVLALLAGFSLAAIAGPGPQYWQQQEKLRAENAARKAQAAPHDHATMACTACTTSLVTEYSPTNVAGKWAPSFRPIGSRHECTACTGAITRLRGQVTDTMKVNCPLCAKAKSENVACCTLPN